MAQGAEEKDGKALLTVGPLLGQLFQLLDGAGIVAVGYVGYGAEKGFFGAVTGALSTASAGISAAIVFSFLMAVVFQSRSKKN